MTYDPDNPLDTYGSTGHPLWWDRNGEPISIDEFEAHKMDPSYCRIGDTRIYSPTGPDRFVDVSTVWLGIDFSIAFPSERNPVIFETMTFPSRPDILESVRVRYRTESEARSAHARIVAEIAEALGATADHIIDAPGHPAIAPTPERPTE